VSGPMESHSKKEEITLEALLNKFKSVLKVFQQMVRMVFPSRGMGQLEFYNDKYYNTECQCKDKIG
jgi:hypothetical protein